jgi:hypothetical protein
MGHWGLQDLFAESTGFTVGASPTGVTQGAIRALFYVLKSEFLQGPTLSPERSLEGARFFRGNRESINTIYFNDF